MYKFLFSSLKFYLDDHEGSKKDLWSLKSETLRTVRLSTFPTCPSKLLGYDKSLVKTILPVT